MTTENISFSPLEKKTMDLEEFDLDMLTELLDQENEPQSNPAIAPCEQRHNQTTNSHDNKMSKTNRLNAVFETEARVLKDVDIFSKRSNNPLDEHNGSKFESLVHTAEADSSDNDENQSCFSETTELIKQKITDSKPYDKKRHYLKIKTWRDDKATESSNRVKDEDINTVDSSGIRIINPSVSREVMRDRMSSRKLIKMSFLKSFMKNGDIKGDWFTIGVLVHKSAPKTSKNNKTFSIWKMTDLIDVEKLVSIFLFGTVHADLWKTAVGTVVGILNPSFMPNQSANEIALSVDHAGKFMIVGTSKDFGHCMGRRKDGESCTSVVNKARCEFCTYHVSKEYKKLSAKRTDLQTSYSGWEPSFKNRILKGQNVMYGGQMYSTPPTPKNSSAKQKNMKDQLTLNSLGLKRKVEALVTEERSNKVPKLSSAPAMKRTVQSEFIAQQLAIPSVGSRNLTQHLAGKETKDSVEPKNMISITPKDLLKMHEMQIKERKNMVKPLGEIHCDLNITPQLGRGLKPDGEICFDTKFFLPKNKMSPHDIAKIRAIQTIKHKGPLKHQDPNETKNAISPESVEKIKLKLEKSIEDEKREEQEPQDFSNKGLLGSVDPEKLQRILSRKSSHAFEVEMAEMEQQEAYFCALEKKEKLEDKMATITEIVCSVVSCKTCKYTAHQAADRCKNENHILKCHKALKKFFKCTHCSRRTCSFSKFPTRPCRNCGESSFERTSMLKPRSGPKLNSETLNIRGDEIKYLNSLKS